MIKRVFFILIFYVSFVYALGVYINETEFSVIIKFTSLKEYFEVVEKTDDKIILILKRNISFEPIEKPKNKLLKDIKGVDNKIIITLKTEVDYFLKKDDKDIYLFITPKKKIADLNLKSPIEKPILKTKSKKIKDDVAEKILAEVESEIDNGLYDSAINKLLDLIAKHENDFYAQEAYYKLGMLYYKLGENDPKNYLRAADYLSDFASKFPDNYRASDALYYSALSKEKAGMYFEAIFDYKAIIVAYPETLFAKKSYMRIVSIYENIGQYDKAINALKEYSDKFKDKSINVLARIGKLYAMLKDYELAREYFLKVINTKDDLLKLGADTLFAIAKTFEIKGDEDYALSIYAKVYNIYPDSKYADIAMYNSALLLEKIGKEKLANSLLLECRKKYSKRIGGQKAAIHYVEKYLDENATEYWIDFLMDVLDSSLDVNLTAKANRLIIQSYFREKRYDEALEKISEFESKYFDTPELNNVYDIKQKIFLNFAKNYLKEGKYQQSIDYINKLITEFPETKYLDEAEKLAESISLIKVRELYEKGNYENVMKKIQEYMVNHKKIYFKKSWDDILENSYYHYIKKLIEQNVNEKAATLCKEYLIYFPKGKYKNEFLSFLTDYFINEILQYIKKGNYASGITFYIKNNSWIKLLENKNNVAIIKGYLAFCYFKLGDFEEAKHLYDEIKNYNFSIVNVLGILFGEKITDENVNKLSDEDLKIIFDELKISKKDDAYKILKLFRKNPILKYRLMYELVNTFEKERKRAELKNIYKNLENLNLIKEFKEILLDRGMIAFEEGDYKLAIKLFEKFIFQNKDYSEMDKVYYFLGKSYLKMGDDKAKKFYNKLIQNYPTSFYTKLAEKELKELNWLKRVEETK
ncbi:tetratricopeptide repeat protein [Deferribacter autotrophicus]|uniref:Tetratricopeptide repeat protein n=1 Tax=Deferribacter autotrophicus TaxID=500465 RepID=A0A5A8F5V0_9BACT|nr:tetratricopeptide repeat protein [Deferribacter autotrophicus]KAA0259506.1 tetratricopeptide repeat protein [Deferribacter autotrophicus]